MSENFKDSYLVLHQDDRRACFYQSLFCLRQSWATDWIGLPVVLKSCAVFLSLQADALSLQARAMLSAALLAVAGHDFMHLGGVNEEVSQIEKQTCELLRPILKESKVAPVWTERVETAIIRSDFSLAAQNHERVSGVEFAWNQQWLNVLLNEADILASINQQFGPELSHALAQEWKIIGFDAKETVATPEGRQAFLSSVKFSSRSSGLLSSALKN